MNKKTMEAIIREIDLQNENKTAVFDGIASSGASVIGKSSQKGLQDGWSRATFILKKEYIEKLKALSYWERTTIKEIVDDALSNYFRDKDIKL